MTARRREKKRSCSLLLKLMSELLIYSGSLHADKDVRWPVSVSPIGALCHRWESGITVTNDPPDHPTSLSATRTSVRQIRIRRRGIFVASRLRSQRENETQPPVSIP